MNPKKTEIDGQKVYSDIELIEERLDAVSFIVNPKIGYEILKKADKKNVKIVWFQPGAESEKIIEYCKENGIDCIYNACVLADM